LGREEGTFGSFGGTDGRRASDRLGREGGEQATEAEEEQLTKSSERMINLFFRINYNLFALKIKKLVLLTKVPKVPPPLA
jgi:hypothetical protein